MSFLSRRRRTPERKWPKERLFIFSFLRLLLILNLSECKECLCYCNYVSPKMKKGHIENGVRWLSCLLPLPGGWWARSHNPIVQLKAELTAHKVLKYCFNGNAERCEPTHRQPTVRGTPLLQGSCWMTMSVSGSKCPCVCECSYSRNGFLVKVTVILSRQHNDTSQKGPERPTHTVNSADISFSWSYQVCV